MRLDAAHLKIQVNKYMTSILATTTTMATMAFSWQNNYHKCCYCCCVFTLICYLRFCTFIVIFVGVIVDLIIASAIETTITILQRQLL